MDRTRRFRLVRFHITLIGLVVVVLSAATLATLIIVFSISREVSTRNAAQLFQEAGHRVEDRLNQHLTRATQLASLIATLPDAAAPIRTDGRSYPLVSFLSETLQAFPGLYSVYVGHADGSFLQLIHAAGDSRVLNAHQAVAETTFILRAIDAGPGVGRERVESWTFIAADGTVLCTRNQPNPTYNPAQRPWFIGALARSGQAVLTDPYVFDSLREPGITASRLVAGGSGGSLVNDHVSVGSGVGENVPPGTEVGTGQPDNVVIGVDITLQDLRGFLDSVEVSPGAGLMLLDHDGRVLAASSRMERRLNAELLPLAPIRETQSPARALLLAALNADETTILRDNGNAYLGWGRLWDTMGGRTYRLVLMAPVDDFLGHLYLMQRRILLGSVAVLLLFFPLVYLTSRSFSRFLEALAGDAGRIRRFNFAGETPTHTAILEFDQLSHAFALMKETLAVRTNALRTAREKLERIIELSVAMSVEPDSNRLVELILKGAKEIAHADGGSLYLKNEHDQLEFKIVLNDSLRFAQGGTSSDPITMPPVDLFNADGSANVNNVVSYAVHTGTRVAIDDAYDQKVFDFSGTRRFDQLNGYRSRSFLTIPLKVHGGEIIGALQLINSISPLDGAVIPFDIDIQGFVEALGAEAAAVLHNRGLTVAQIHLFDALIELIAGAIDAKSPYTGGHCARVPELALMLAEEAERTDAGGLAPFHFASEDERRAFRIGAWLHDCGKVTTPEYVIDKSVKLETIYNRIHEIRTRFEVVRRDARIHELEAVGAGADAELARAERERTEAQLAADFAFVAACNIGSESMDPQAVARLHRIAQRKWFRSFDPTLGLAWEEKERYLRTGGTTAPAPESLLADKPEHVVPHTDNPAAEYRGFDFILETPSCLYNRGELHNLSVTRGTLTPEERFKINEHIMQTIVMLETLPFPEELKRVPEFAGTHHETLTGTGYPRGLRADELSVPARIMAIADIFEALTADRPYKRAKTLSEAVSILYEFKRAGQIDADLFDLFLTSGVYRRYGMRYLDPHQLDEVDVTAYVG